MVAALLWTLWRGLETAPSWETKALQAVGLPGAELDVRVTPERSEGRNLKAF